jgi:hypothetical protein
MPFSRLAGSHPCATLGLERRAVALFCTLTTPGYVWSAGGQPLDGRAHREVLDHHQLSEAHP